jgi:hypothetical protein
MKKMDSLRGAFMGKKNLTIVSILLSVLAFIVVVPVHGAVSFTPETKFEIPENDGGFNFEVGGSYSSSSLENGIWHFVGLTLDNYVVDLSNTFPGRVLYGRELLPYLLNDGNFSVSLQNCEITITNYDLITGLNRDYNSGWLNYTVNGVGTQTFNLHFYHATGRASWTVYIDGIARSENDSWSISRSSTDEWITVTGAANNVSIYYDELGPKPRIEPPTEPSNDPPTEIRKDIQSDIERNIGIIIVALTLTIIIILSSYLILHHKRKQNTLLTSTEKKPSS